MASQSLAQQALALADESAGKLERWSVLFENRLAEAEQEGRLLELKEFVAYLTALKRTLEIARLAQAITPGAEGDHGTLDSEALRKILLEED